MCFCCITHNESAHESGRMKNIKSHSGAMHGWCVCVSMVSLTMRVRMSQARYMRNLDGSKRLLIAFATVDVCKSCRIVLPARSKRSSHHRGHRNHKGCEHNAIGDEGVGSLVGMIVSSFCLVFLSRFRTKKKNKNLRRLCGKIPPRTCHSSAKHRSIIKKNIEQA